MSQQINLFNPIFLQQKKIFSARTMAQALAVLLVGISLIAGVAWRRVNALKQEAASLAAQVAGKQARLNGVNANFAPRQSSEAVAAEVAEAEAQLAALRDVSRIIEGGDLGNTQGYAEYFRALARQHAEGLWLTGVTITGAGADMSVQGRALSAALVPGYIARLAREPVLRGKSFGNLQITQVTPAPPPQAAPAALASAAAVPAARDPLTSGLAALGLIPSLVQTPVKPPPVALTIPVSAQAAPAPVALPYIEFALKSGVVEDKP